MKHALIFLLLFSSSFAFSQTNILDSTVGWDSIANQNMLTLFLSDSVGVSTVNVHLGTEHDNSNVFSSDYTVGNNVFITNNMLTIPLTGVPVGEYFVEVIIERTDASTQLIEYQTQ